MSGVHATRSGGGCTDSLELPRADDLHVHLRQGAMLNAVAPLVARGGVGRCLVMPNTDPPIDTVAAALEYERALRAAEPRVDYLLTLYLSPRLTPDEIRRAAASGIAGVKLYPKGVTTHSSAGVHDLAAHDALFAAMEAEDLVLEIHGEVPSGGDICVLNAEEAFLPQIERLHRDFPRLRIVLEHVTTAAAVACVGKLGANVAATVTAHHLDLTADDWAGRNHNFCKPVAKYPSDREALRAVVAEGHPRFFLGSDSAPHPRGRKECAEACAGVFSSPQLLAYLADTFDRLGCLHRLPAFATEFGRAFYCLPPAGETVRLERRAERVPEAWGDVVPYRAGATLSWAVATG